MANKTNVTINGKQYFRIKRKVGKKRNSAGVWVSDYKTFYGDSKKAALEKYNAYMSRRSSSSSEVLGELIDRWIENVFLLNGRYKETTKALYIDAYRNNFSGLSVCGQSISDVRAVDLQDALNSLSCGFSSVKGCYKLLRLFFAYASNIGLCDDITSSLIVPAQKVNRSEGIIIWTDEEVKQILTASEGFYLRLLLVLALRTGCRFSELLGLKYSDIDGDTLNVSRQVVLFPIFEEGRRVGSRYDVGDLKTAGSVRSIPLGSDTLDEIRKHRERQKRDSEYIFTTSSGRFCDRRSVSRALKRFYNSAGIPEKPFHAYRHTFASRLARSGVPIQTVAALLGHSNISVTAKYYVNIASDEKKRAISALDL